MHSEHILCEGGRILKYDTVYAITGQHETEGHIHAFNLVISFVARLKRELRITIMP